MTIDRDPLDVLASLAPPHADPALLAPAYTRTMALRSAPPRRRWTWRGTVVGVAVLALSTGGIGLATADEPVPREVLELFDRAGVPVPGAPEQPVPDPASAERIAAVPYDDDHQFSLWTADGSDGATCLGSIIEATSGGDWPTDGSFATCNWPADSPLHVPDHLETASLLVMSQVDHGPTHFMATAGESVRATIRFSDGSDRELLTGGDHIFGWVPEGKGPGVVTGYLPDGSVGGTFTVHG